MEDGRIVLRSLRLGREVIPRLTSAHNFALHGMAVYRFLGLLQHQGHQGFRFEWGPLAHAAFLPRVVFGRTVLAPAQWNVDVQRLHAWGAARGAARFEAVQRFRREARLPRWVHLREAESPLVIDLDNVLSVEMLVHLVKDRSGTTLEELLPQPGQLCVEGTEGHHVHELIVPFVKSAAAARPAPIGPRTSPAPRPFQRSFPPGSEWLYTKFYAGAATLDRLLLTTFSEVARKAVACGAADSWFFIRHEDPEAHVRLRFHGEPARLDGEVWPALRSAFSELLGRGQGWRVQLDTYEREVERYGGPEGILLVEGLFAADSDAALSLLHALPESGEPRWRVLLKSMDALLEDLGLGLAEKAGVVERARAAFGAELRPDRRSEEQLGLRYRQERPSLEALLGMTPPAGKPWPQVLAALQLRSERLRPLAERLREAEQGGKLTVPVTALAESLLHMHANRMLPAEARAHERVLYDFLARLYASRLARLQG